MTAHQVPAPDHSAAESTEQPGPGPDRVGEVPDRGVCRSATARLRADRHGHAPRVLCGVNGSTSSRRALADAVRRAASCGGRLTVVTAYDAAGYFWGALASLPGGDLLPVPDLAVVREAEEATLRAFVDDVLSDPGLAALVAEAPVAIETRAVPGRPVDVLVRESAEAAALVVGHAEDSGSASVAVGCLRRAHCPVTVVPGAPRSVPAPPG